MGILTIRIGARWVLSPSARPIDRKLGRIYVALTWNVIVAPQGSDFSWGKPVISGSPHAHMPLAHSGGHMVSVVVPIEA